VQAYRHSRTLAAAAQSTSNVIFFITMWPLPFDLIFLAWLAVAMDYRVVKKRAIVWKLTLSWIFCSRIKDTSNRCLNDNRVNRCIQNKTMLKCTKWCGQSNVVAQDFSAHSVQTLVLIADCFLFEHRHTKSQTWLITLYDASAAYYAPATASMG